MKIRSKCYKIIKKIHGDKRTRYTILVLERNDMRYFYKRLNNVTKKHFHTQILFQKRVEKSGQRIILPKLYDYNFKVKRPWALWEYLPGRLLAQWKPKKTSNLERWLVPIAETIIKIQNIKPLPTEFDIVNKMILRVNQWSEEPIKSGALKVSAKNKIIGFIEKNRALITNGFNHADLVPWHMYEIKYPRFALVDYEGSKNKPFYYDVAYFYHRVYTKLAEPELADKFLKIYKEKASSPKEFDQIFATILGARIIGGFYDCLVKKDGTDIKLHQQLLNTSLSKM